MNNRTLRRCAAALMLAFAAVALSSCAMFAGRNHRLFKKVDKRMRPKSAPARIALFPVGFVAAYGSLGVDAAATAATHPFKMMPEAWDDTHELYWEKHDASGGGTLPEDSLRESVIFVGKAVLTPPTVVGDWAVKTLFNSGPKRDKPPEGGSD